MSIVKKVMKMLLEDSPEERIIQQEIYKKVAKEMEDGFTDQGLVMKAKANSDGDPNRADSLYIKYRAQYHLDEFHKNLSALKKSQAHSEEKERIERIKNDRKLKHERKERAAREAKEKEERRIEARKEINKREKAKMIRFLLWSLVCLLPLYLILLVINHI